ncbi:hypothetical protein CBER1_06539 [Cercospora berteroae]|uniref:Uncharacterized protein n=1 Tax=Cercospora berteroae TaxID=357750 RepID=A0A2S6BTX7_9PEZI|nr:hypothetical protein CBER1_06539 [Cercospora berteroae]
MARALRSSTTLADSVSQDEPITAPPTSSRRSLRIQEKPKATSSNPDPQCVPSGSERMTDQFFATYGWRERSTTLSQFDFSSRAFCERQGLEPEEWDMVEMTEKRNLLNNEPNHSEKKIDHKEWGNMTLFFTRAMEGAYSPSE